MTPEDFQRLQMSQEKEQRYEGCAPSDAQRAVIIERGVYEDFQELARRTHCKPETAINAALAEWLGRV